MPPLDERLELPFDWSSLELSARRLWEHTELGQINPFSLITSASADQPSNYVDVIDVSGPVPTLTGLTLADLQAGNYGSLVERDVLKFLRLLKDPIARQWLAGVATHLRRTSRQRALRNRPDPFLPADASEPLGIRGLHCALHSWVSKHRAERASASQWAGRLANLSKGGLREEEFAMSELREALSNTGSQQVTGDTLFALMKYDALRLSILPVIRPVLRQLEFTKVPANAEVKRLKPKIKAGPELHPQWRDRVLGYWVDMVEWSDLLGAQRAWMAHDHRGRPLVSIDTPTGLCATPAQAQGLASDDAARVFPKLTAMGNWAKYRLTGGEEYREWLVTLPYWPPRFASTHFEHCNVLLHVRCDMREGPDGEHVLLVHEVQSDWAQEARRALSCQPSSADTMPVPPWLNEWPALALKLMLLHAALVG